MFMRPLFLRLIVLSSAVTLYATNPPLEHFEQVKPLLAQSLYYFHDDHLFVNVSTNPLEAEGIHAIRSLNSLSYLETWTAEKAVINSNGIIVDNPLKNCTPTLIHPATIEGYPLIALKEKPADIFIAHPRYGDQPQSITHLPSLVDAHGQLTSGIKALAYGQTDTNDILNKTPHIFALVAPCDQKLGHPGTGLACYAFHRNSVTSKEQDGKETKEVTKTTAQWDIISSDSLLPAAFPFDLQQMGIDLGGLDHLYFDKKILLHWNNGIERLYVGFSGLTRSDATAQEGIGSISVGRVWNKKLYLEPLCLYAPQAAEGIVTAFGADKELNLHHMTSFFSKSQHLYLIIVGGVGTAEETNRTVHALPLINYEPSTVPPLQQYESFMTNPAYGTLAAPSFIIRQEEAKFYGRSLSCSRCYHAPTQSAEITHFKNSLLKIGAGSSLPGPISAIKVVGDALVASVKNADAGYYPGIFYSQALYDAQGHIMAWTPWRRLLGVTSSVNDFSMDVSKGLLWYISQDNNETLCMRQTQWSQADTLLTSTSTGKENAGIIERITQQFSQEEGGILGYAEAHNLFMIMGNKKIVLAQKVYIADLLTKNVPASHYLIGTLEDPVLSSLGPLSCGTVFEEEAQRWLIVGGPNGLAILKNPITGHGWSQEKSTEKSIKYLQDQCTQGALSFSILGNYTFVKKIVKKDQDLFIATDNAIYTMPFSASVINNLNSEAACIAHKDEIGAIFDFASIGSVLLAATTTGLWKKEYTSAHDQTSWELIPIPHASGPVQELYLIPDATETIAQLYLLSYTPLARQTTVHAFFIDGTADKKYGSQRFQLVPEYEDITVNPTNKPLLSSNGCRSCFATDGMLYWTVIPPRLAYPTEALLLPSKHRKLSWYKPNMCHPIGKILPRQQVNHIFYSTFLETWVALGEFGILSTQ